LPELSLELDIEDDLDCGRLCNGRLTVYHWPQADEGRGDRISILLAKNRRFDGLKEVVSKPSQDTATAQIADCPPEETRAHRRSLRVVDRFEGVCDCAAECRFIESKTGENILPGQHVRESLEECI